MVNEPSLHFGWYLGISHAILCLLKITMALQQEDGFLFGEEPTLDTHVVEERGVLVWQWADSLEPLHSPGSWDAESGRDLVFSFHVQHASWSPWS